MMKATCRELVDAVVRDDMDEAGRARIARHVQRCESCAAQARARAAVSAAVLANDDHLDDLTRTRVLARLGQTIDEVAARRADRKAGARVRWAGASGLAVVVAAATLLAWHRVERPVVRPPPAPPVVVQTPVSPPALPQDEGPMLTPYAVEGAETPREAQLGKARDHLALPARATMRAHLAARADLTLVGPLELAVTSASRELVVLELLRGTLVGDYDGTQGGRLRVRSGDVTVEIVGTRFAIATGAAGTEVSVAHGTVRVEHRGEVRMLTNGQSWRAGGKTLEPVPRQISLLFAQRDHQPARPAQSQAAAPLPRPAPPVEPAPVALRSPTPAGPRPRPALPAAPAPKPSAAPPIAPVTAASLYRLAESALQRGDDTRGQQLLSELVTRFPADPAADAARFEMALIFEKTGQTEQAFALTEEIVRGRSKGPFVGPARLLRCRLARAAQKVMADCAAK
jgi:ferric-dicitrate binding protein FerR (iron transport regulator)